jgi:hypothetical protein
MQNRPGRIQLRLSPVATPPLALMAFLAATLLSAIPSMALEDKDVYGVWKAETDDPQVDTIRFKRRHYFDRITLSYSTIKVPKPDGSEISAQKLARKVEDKGLWYVVEGRIRAKFKRSVDGKLDEKSASSDPYTIYLAKRDGGLVLEEVDGEALPPEQQILFKKTSTSREKHEPKKH